MEAHVRAARRGEHVLETNAEVFHCQVRHRLLAETLAARLVGPRNAPAEPDRRQPAQVGEETPIGALRHPPFREKEDVHPFIAQGVEPRDEVFETGEEQVLAVPEHEPVGGRLIPHARLQQSLGRRAHQTAEVGLSPEPLLRQLRLDRLGPASERERTDRDFRREHPEQVRRPDRPVEEVHDGLAGIARSRHRRVVEVEVHHEHAVARIGGLPFGVRKAGGFTPVAVGRHRGEPDERERLDALQPAVLEDLEIAGCQPVEELALPPRVHVDRDERRARTEHLGTGLPRGSVLGSHSDDGRQGQATDDDAARAADWLTA